MQANPHLQDEVYRIVGEEVARKEFHPGPMARAVAESAGQRELIESLYVKCRFEELRRQFEMQAAAEQVVEDQRLRQINPLLVKCPSCGFRGVPVRKPRGNWLLLLLLLFLWVVPGVIYMLVFHGYKGVCSKCGKTLTENMSRW